jgi:hypothetical protein
MLNAPTLDKLHALKLAAMAAAWTEQQHQADMTALAFDERFGLLVEAEWLARENKRPRAPCRRPSSSSRRRASKRSTIRRAASSTKPSSASSPPAAGSRNITT